MIKIVISTVVPLFPNVYSKETRLIHLDIDSMCLIRRKE